MSFIKDWKQFCQHLEGKQVAWHSVQGRESHNAGAKKCTAIAVLRQYGVLEWHAVSKSDRYDGGWNSKEP